MTREEILTAIRGLAEKLGRVPSLDELHTKTAVSCPRTWNMHKTATTAQRHYRHAAEDGVAFPI